MGFICDEDPLTAEEKECICTVYITAVLFISCKDFFVSSTVCFHFSGLYVRICVMIVAVTIYCMSVQLNQLIYWPNTSAQRKKWMQLRCMNHTHT